MFSVTSIFVNLSETMAELGFLVSTCAVPTLKFTCNCSCYCPFLCFAESFATSVCSGLGCSCTWLA